MVVVACQESLSSKHELRCPLQIKPNNELPQTFTILSISEHSIPHGISFLLDFFSILASRRSKIPSDAGQLTQAARAPAQGRRQSRQVDVHATRPQTRSPTMSLRNRKQQVYQNDEADDSEIILEESEPLRRQLKSQIEAKAQKKAAEIVKNVRCFAYPPKYSSHTFQRSFFVSRRFLFPFGLVSTSGVVLRISAC